MTAAAPSTRTSRTLDLTYGPCFFELAEPAPDAVASGRTVVLIHGIAGTHRVFDPTVEPLRAAGHRVVRLDLYGRGASAKPRVAYDLALFCGQLRELLAELEVDGPVDVIAQSMGGAVAIGFTDLYPERVGRLVLLAPAGLQRSIPLPVRLARVGALGATLFGVVGPFAIRLGLRRSFNDPSTEGARRFLDHAAAQTQDPGYLYAQNRSLHDLPLFDLEDAYRRVGAGDREAMVIWGTRDRIAPFTIYTRALEVLPNATFHALEGAGHVCCYEEPERVNPLLVEFLAR